jgi:ATP-dependent protease ClpP protease subunit
MTRAAPSTNNTARESAGIPVLRLEGGIGGGQPVNLRYVSGFLARADITHGLRVVIDSPGGNRDEAISIYNTIRALPVPTWAHVERECCSGATLIYMAASYRTAAPGAEFLFHATRIEKTSLPDGHLTARDLRRYAEGLEKQDADMVTVLARRTGSSPAWFADQLETEYPVSAAELLNPGIVHEIVGLTFPAGGAFLRELPKLKARGHVADYYSTANFRAACEAADHFPEGRGG